MRSLGWVVGLVIACQAGAAHGEPSEAEISVARDLGTQGMAAWDGGNYPDAADKLERAYAVLKVPTLGLWSGRALARIGKLVEASERFQAVLRMPLEANAPDQFRQAQTSAEQELAEIKPRIPYLRVEATGALVVTVDGKPINSAMVGLPMPVNPGAHVIEARAGDRSAQRQVTLTEGGRETVKLVLPEVASAAPAEPRDQGTGSSQRLAGYVTLGVGGAGLVLGTVTGLIALGQQGSLDDAGCVDTRCPKSVDDDRNAYNSMRTLSSVGFIVGGVAVAAGAVLLVTAPSEPKQVGLWLGPASAGVKGAF